jgi:hypothetical protein
MFQQDIHYMGIVLVGCRNHGRVALLQYGPRQQTIAKNNHVALRGSYVVTILDISATLQQIFNNVLVAVVGSPNDGSCALLQQEERGQSLKCPTETDIHAIFT